MGLAALIIGIVAVILGFIPVCGMIALVPAIIGLVLGIVDVSKKSKTQEPTGKGKAGIVLNAVAIIVILLWIFVILPRIAEKAPGLIERALEDANVTIVQPAGE